ncbi:MAG TPA: GspH/FimT family pseudopilin [Candidatus Binatia bacterium]|nr:GspH/FimT family pseudopilin [Candidatus Binatia bacterium]
MHCFGMIVRRREGTSSQPMRAAAGGAAAATASLVRARDRGERRACIARGAAPTPAGRSRHRATSRVGGEAGWTLMELLVACSMFAILGAIAVPKYTAVALQMRTSAAATHVLADLNFAREMAQRTGVPHYVDVTAGSGVNYTVKREKVPPAISADDDAVRTQSLGTRLPGVNFSLNGATVDPYGVAAAAATPPGRLIFTARGLPVAPGSFFIASSDGNYSYVVSVTGAGRIRLFTKDGSGWR